ncbi:MAG: hypothetical protein ACK5L6_03925 [Anaerorhabdus sp.]|uniref:hypothetical protein n=1 Tax=Anaerorhabdus sp. TaxID=1872524 RepID=UPI003A8A5148
MAAGINLATKYDKALQQPFAIESVIEGRFNDEFEWDGTKSIHVYTAITQELNDYKRTGANRYGEPKELQDDEQDLPVTKEKSFAITVDKGNNNDQMHVKRTGKVTNAQMKEQVVPFWDKYSLSTWVTGAGKKIIADTLDKDTIIDQFIAARTHLVNNKFPINVKDCTCYIKTSAYAHLLKNPAFLGVETLAKELLTKGTVGQCMNFLIKEVPDDYLPATTHMLFTHKKPVIKARKLHDLNIHNNPPGLRGTLIEGCDYGDAFVLNTFKQGVVNIASA